MISRPLARLGVALSLLLAGSSAWSGAGTLQTVVTPLSTNVTYSLVGPPALTVYVGYKVRIANLGGNTINNIRFTGGTAVAAGRSAVFDTSEGANCTTTNSAGTSITCSIGQLRAGSAAPEFVVFFRTPVLPVGPGCAAPPGACGVSETVAFTGITYYAEGTGGANSVPINSTDGWASGGVALGTTNIDLVRSAIPKAGATVYTGTGNAATLADPWLTVVTVPSRTSYTTSELFEQSSAIPLASDLFSRETTTLTIPGTFQSLTILLRRDVSTIAPKAKIASARIYYSAGTDDPGMELHLCTSTGGPSPGAPCISRRTEYTKRNAPSAAWEGDWEFEILALDNGRYSQ